MGDLAIAASVNPPPSGLDTYSKILGIKQAQQTLQTGAYVQQQQRAQAQQQQQDVNEMQALLPIMRDPVSAGVLDASGNETPNAKRIILAAAPKTGLDKYGDLVKAARGHVQLQNDMLSLNSNTRAALGSRLQGAVLNAKTPEDATAALDSVVKEFQGTGNEENVNRIGANIREGILDTYPKHGMEGVQKLVTGVIRGNLSPAELAGTGGLVTPQAGTMDVGGQLYPGAQATGVMGGGFTPAGPPVTKTIPPQVITTPSGQIGTVPAGGGGLPTVGGTATTAPTKPAAPGAPKLEALQRPGMNAPRVDQENYNQQIESARHVTETVRALANDPMNGVQSTRFRNQRILELIPHANTGPGRDLLNKVASALPGSSGDTYQDLEHYTAQNSAALAKAMGVPGTNLGAETAAAAAGNVQRNPGALAEITRTNDALNTAFDLYNRGLAKVTRNGNDMSRVNSYTQAFGSNLDVNALRWADAHRHGDKQEQAKLEKQMGAQGLAAARQRLRILKSLAENGDLP